MDTSGQNEHLKQQRAKAARSAILLGIFAFLVFAAFIGATMMRGQ